MAEESDVKVKFGASTEGLKSGIEEAKEKIESLSEPVRGVLDAFNELKEALIAAFAVEAISEFAEHMGELGEQTERTSKILGITTEQVGELQYIAAMTGASTESLTTMMTRFGAGLPEAAKGTGRIAAGLHALGLSAKELLGLNFDQRLNRIAEAVSGFADSQSKTDAVAALGRGFVQLIPTLDEGVEGLDKLRAGAHEAGVALDPEMTERLVAMQHGMVDMKESMTGATVQGFNPFINVVNGASAIMRDLSVQFAESSKQGGVMYVVLGSIAEILKHIEQGIGELILILKDVAIDGTLAFRALSDGVIGFGKIMDDVASAMSKSFAEFWRDLLAAGTSTFLNIGAAAENMAAGIGFALHGDFANAKVAFAGIAENAGDAATAVGKAFGEYPLDWSKAEGDLKATNEKLKQDLETRNKEILDAAKIGNAEYNLIWGIKGTEQEGKPPPTAQVPPLQPDSKAKKDDTAEKAAEEEAEHEIKLAKTNAETKEKLLDGELKRREITTSQWLAGTEAALNAELAATTAAYQKELEVADLTAQQRKAIHDKLTEAIAANEEKIVAAQQKAADETYAAWKSAGDKVAEVLNSQVDGLLKGTESLRTAFKNMAASIIEDLAKLAIKSTIEKGATGLAGLFSGSGGGVGTFANGPGQAPTFGAGANPLSTAMSALTAAVGLSTTASAANAISTDANTGATLSQTVATISNTIATWAAAITHLFGFAEGTPYVKNTGVALIHQGEQIVPAADNPNNPRNGGSGSRANDGGSGGGVTHNHSFGDIHVYNSGGELDPENVVKALSAAVQSGHHLGLPAFR